MICVNRDQIIIDGEGSIVATELAVLLNTLREEDKAVTQGAMACLYSDGGRNTITEALAMFKEDTTEILKQLERKSKK